MPERGSGAVTTLEIFEGLLSWGLRIAGLAIVAITGYYVYGTLQQSDQLFRAMGPNGQVSPQDFMRHLNNVTMFTNILFWASILVVVCALGRYYRNPEAGLALLVLGAVLFFGVPLLIQNAAGGIHLPRNLARLGDPRAVLLKQYGLSGAVVLGAAVIDLLVHAVLWVTQFRERRPKPNAEAEKTAAQVRKANDQFLGPCWKLPFCRDTEKQLCPVRHSKKPCWRTGRGCYCDQNIILTLSGGSQYAASRGSLGYLSRTATVARPKSFSEKREQCLSCPVYLHHQSQKYRLLAPLAILGVIGGFAFYWSSLATLYPEAMKFLGRTFAGLSFGRVVNGVPDWATDLANSPGMMWLIVGVSVMLLAAYLLQAVEWTLYRLGI